VNQMRVNGQMAESALPVDKKPSPRKGHFTL
jgi:hypothetical protein